MKPLILTLLLAFFTICLYSQTPQIDDNTIIVKTGADSTTYNNLKVLLITNGYRIKEQDQSIGYIQTDYKPIEGSTVAVEPEVAISILIKETNITMYANYKFKGSTGLGSTEYSGRADYQKRPNIGRRLAFDELHSFAKRIGTEIYFVKQ